jgi:hypothetical protein
MEILKPALPARLKMLFMACIVLSAALIDCSEFNQPVMPSILFTREAYDQDSLVGVRFDYDARLITLYIMQDFGVTRWTNATLFIKMRNNNEYTTKNLRHFPFDFRMDFVIDTNMSSAHEPWQLSYKTFDSLGNMLDSDHNKFNADNTTRIFLRKKFTPDIQTFFWQIEFYNDYGMVKLPEQPGIWYFGLADWY